MIDGDRRSSWSGRFSSIELGDWEKFADSFFFCNFPESCELKDLWRAFNRVGKVLDVFISKKRTQKGSRFGFVRFKKGNNINQVEADLKDLWFGSYRLRANKSKFKRNPSSSKDQTRRNVGFSGPENSKIVEGKSFTDAVRFSPAGMDNQAVSDNARGMLLTKEASAESPKHLESLKLDSTEEVWLSRCLVGELKNDALIKNIENLLKMENFAITSVKSLGGRRVLLECSSTESRNKLLESLDCYNQWFAWLHLWNSNFSRAGRIVKLNCFGVPLQAWNKQNFQKIGELVGEVVEVEEGTINKLNLICGSVLIFTNDWNTISQKIDIQVDNTNFSVLVHEESQLQDEFKDFRVGISDRESHYSSSVGFISDSGDEELPENLGSGFSDEEVDQIEGLQRSLNECGREYSRGSIADEENHVKVEKSDSPFQKNSNESKKGSISQPGSSPLNVLGQNQNGASPCRSEKSRPLDRTEPFPLVDSSSTDPISTIKEVGDHKNGIHTTREGHAEKDKDYKTLSEILLKLDVTGQQLNFGSKQNKGRRKKTRLTVRKKKSKNKGQVEILAPQIDGASISDDGIRNMVRILKNASVSSMQSKNSEELEKTMLLANELGVKFDNINDEELADLFGC